MTASIDEKPVLTVAECAEYLRISPWTAYERVRTGDIPVLRMGRRILVSRVVLERMLEQAGGGSDG